MSVDLNSLKENIQSILQTANTTTASPDLSSGLTKRVKKVLKINPSRLSIQPSYFPFITIFIDSKDIELSDIARNQTTAKRTGTIEIKIMGSIWNNKIKTIFEDSLQ